MINNNSTGKNSISQRNPYTSVFYSTLNENRTRMPRMKILYPNR